MVTTNGDILGDTLNNLAVRYTGLHVNIGTPCRELYRAETVQKTIITCCNKNWFILVLITLATTRHKDCLWLYVDISKVASEAWNFGS